ncbi:hypothetical protein GCM10009716_26590 [Streptomyces sodiiphilus]|uniref:Uncharacterized protein n=1 Tax=Streptomyces sodiiphilus TaxID=226217 RepID=A0ABN2P9Y1_9ACTN
MAGLRNLAIGHHRQDGHTTSQPPSVTPSATTCGPSPPSARRNEPGHKITFERPGYRAFLIPVCVRRGDCEADTGKGRRLVFTDDVYPGPLVYPCRLWRWGQSV